jgi:hypothetical protein
MKRLFILIVLLGLANVFTGCQEKTGTENTMSTNTVPAAPAMPSTNMAK